MAIINQSRNTLLATEVQIAATFFSRLRGLLGKPGLAAGSALVIRPCNSVHTIGMRFPIDVLFVGADQRVKKAAERLGPWQVAWAAGAAFVIELPAGVVAAGQTRAGDLLTLD